MGFSNRNILFNTKCLVGLHHGRTLHVRKLYRKEILPKMKKTSFSFKKDKYKSARGGYSRLLNVCCRKCEGVVLVYQKDGPGNLRRLYLDRIFAPDQLVGLQTLNTDTIPALTCNKCSEILGTPYIYIKEKRKAFRLHQDSVIKRLRKLDE